MSIAIVHKESTLGLLLTKDEYIDTATPNHHYMSILHASVIKGSSFNPLSGPVVVNKADFRLATKEDFDNFRVSWHPDYEVA